MATGTSQSRHRRASNERGVWGGERGAVRKGSGSRGAVRVRARPAHGRDGSCPSAVGNATHLGTFMAYMDRARGGMFKRRAGRRDNTPGLPAPSLGDCLGRDVRECALGAAGRVGLDREVPGGRASFHHAARETRVRQLEHLVQVARIRAVNNPVTGEIGQRCAALAPSVGGVQRVAEPSCTCCTVSLGYQTLACVRDRDDDAGVAASVVAATARCRW